VAVRFQISSFSRSIPALSLLKPCLLVPDSGFVLKHKNGRSLLPTSSAANRSLPSEQGTGRKKWIKEFSLPQYLSPHLVEKLLRSHPTDRDLFYLKPSYMPLHQPVEVWIK